MKLLPQLNTRELTAIAAIASAVSAVAALGASGVALWQVNVAADAGRDAAVQAERASACREIIGEYGAFEFATWRMIRGHEDGGPIPANTKYVRAEHESYEKLIRMMDADEAYFGVSQIHVLQDARRNATTISTALDVATHGRFGNIGGLHDLAYEQLGAIKTMCHNLLVGNDLDAYRKDRASKS